MLPASVTASRRGAPGSETQTTTNHGQYLCRLEMTSRPDDRAWEEETHRHVCRLFEQQF